jgi:hypothetical protein
LIERFDELVESSAFVFFGDGDEEAVFLGGVHAAEIEAGDDALGF